MSPALRSVVATAAVVSALFTPNAQAARPDWAQLARKSDDWYRGPAGRTAAANVRAHQTPVGDWPKNIDTTAPLPAVDPGRPAAKGTFDNSATTSEVRFLARAHQATGDAADRDAVTRAVDLILKAQYPSGGWPQSYPPGTNYSRHITFNDDTMVHILRLLRDVSTTDIYTFLGPERRASARRAFDAGIACILRCQVTVHGKKTVWCAQHDEITFEPRPARSYELVSLSGAESSEILRLLMSLDNPGPAVVAAIDAGASWFQAARLSGIKAIRVDGDKRIVRDPSAPPLWARFYEIGTNRPFFSGRDGVKKYDIAAIEPERRNGYSWYGSWGTKVAEEYARWKAAQSGFGIR